VARASEVQTNRASVLTAVGRCETRPSRTIETPGVDRPDRRLDTLGETRHKDYQESTSHPPVCPAHQSQFSGRQCSSGSSRSRRAVRETARRRQASVALAAGVGLAAVATWLVVRLVAWVPPWEYFAAPTAAVSAAGLGWVAVTVQTLVPALALRRGLWTPLFPLAAATTLVGFAVLRVGGESDGLVIYAFVFAPFALAAQLLLAGGEFGLRRVVDGSR